MNKLQELDKQFIWHPFTPMQLWRQEQPLVIERGEGVYLYDVDGKRYIDGVSSLWCNVHGHRHPYINQAIRQQLDKIAHSTLLGLTSAPAVELAGQLVKIAPAGLKKVFYSDSGATAVEIALKMAFQYWRNLGQKKRTKFIALKESYHGDTIGAVSIGGIRTFHEIFGPLTFEAIFSPSPHPYRYPGDKHQCLDHCLGTMEKHLQENNSRIAAIIIEPLVQGAAGIIVHPPGFLAGVRHLTDNYNVLMIADEVATGFGRTGTMFACQQERITPDLMCIAKGLTAGYLPLAATITNERVFEAFLREPWPQTTFYHGHTYTGNPLGCAAARASLDVFQKEKTLEHLPEKIALIRQHLREIRNLEYVGDVRQRGMMAGIELIQDKIHKTPFASQHRLGAKFCHHLRRCGVILRPLGDVIVIMPPLAISSPVLTELLQIIQQALRTDLKKINASL